MNTIQYKTYLEESELPECWYNMRADMKKKPAPLLNPATGKLKLLRRFVYTDGDILTPDGHIYGIFDWKNAVELLY